MGNPAEYINSDKYPIHLPDSDDCERLANQCKSSLQKDGFSILKGFVNESILERMAEEADQSILQSHFCRDNHNVFFEEDDISLPKDHPLRIRAVSYTHLRAHET